MSLRDEILQSDDLPTEQHYVPEWGVTVYLRTMTGAQRDAFEASLYTTDKQGNRQASFENMRARLLARVMVDEGGERLFDHRKDSEIVALGGKSAAALDRLFDRAQKLNGIGDEDVEDMVGKSEETAGSDSS